MRRDPPFAGKGCNWGMTTLQHAGLGMRLLTSVLAIGGVALAPVGGQEFECGTSVPKVDRVGRVGQVCQPSGRLETLPPVPLLIWSTLRTNLVHTSSFISPPPTLIIRFQMSIH